MAKQGQTSGQKLQENTPDGAPGGNKLEGLTVAAREAVNATAAGKGLPPVHLWNPPFCGDLDMRIASDGTWFYMGTPIGRPALVRLFSTILKREDGKHFLVTPVEKLGITVEDAPFLAIDADIAADAITFTTNTSDTVRAGPDHAIRVDDRDGAPRPYVHVRRGLDALIDRKTFYRLVEAAQADPGGRLVLRSDGAEFVLG